MQDLQTLVEKTLSGLGYELVDLEISNRGKLIRVFMDKLNPASIKDSINIDDCVLVSNQLGNMLAVEHNIDYDRLEVSSPGLDRILRKPTDFVRFAGERVQIKLHVPLQQEAGEPRRNFLGVLRGVEGDHVLLDLDGNLHKLALSNIDKARLSPEF